jgi:hypothetical protein
MIPFLEHSVLFVKQILIPDLNKQRISLPRKRIVIPIIKGSMMIQRKKVGGNQIQKA